MRKDLSDIICKIGRDLAALSESLGALASVLSADAPTQSATKRQPEPIAKSPDKIKQKGLAFAIIRRYDLYERGRCFVATHHERPKDDSEDRLLTDEQCEKIAREDASKLNEALSVGHKYDGPLFTRSVVGCFTFICLTAGHNPRIIRNFLGELCATDGHASKDVAKLAEFIRRGNCANRVQVALIKTFNAYATGRSPERLRTGDFIENVRVVKVYDTDTGRQGSLFSEQQYTFAR